MEAKSSLREARQHGDLLFPLSVYESRTAGDYRLPLFYHWHPEIELFWIKEGKIRFQTEGKENILEQGDLILVKANALHGSHDCFGQPLVFRALVFDYTFIAGIANDAVDQKYVRPLLLGTDGCLVLREKGRWQEEAVRLLDEIHRLAGEKEEGYELLLKALLLRVLYAMYRQRREQGALEETGEGETGTGELMRKIVAYTKQNYSASVTLDTTAAALAVSKGYFCRFFKKNFGMTYGEYLTDIRLREARRLLAATDWSMERIAQETGFSGGNYFTVCFRKRFGSTPGSWRRQEQEKRSIF